MGTIKVLEPDRQIQEYFIQRAVLGSSGYLSLLLGALDTKSGLSRHATPSRGVGVFLADPRVFYSAGGLGS